MGGWHCSGAHSIRPRARQRDQRRPEVSAHRSLLGPAFALVAVWAIAFSVGPTADVHINDMGVYRGYADALRAGQYPYVDFALEYPPLALLVFAAAGALGTDPGTYEFLLGALMLAAALIVLVLTADLAGLPPSRRDRGLPPSRRARGQRGWTAAWLGALSPLLTGAIMRTHF